MASRAPLEYASVLLTPMDWMSPVNQAQALDKLAQMRPKNGAPAVWPGHEALTPHATDDAGNWLRAASWNTAPADVPGPAGTKACNGPWPAAGRLLQQRPSQV